MAHRKAGIKSIHQKQAQRDQFQKLGQERQARDLEQIRTVLATFKENLSLFAAAHAQEIKKNAAFRGHFNQLCVKVGVDPLASNKGFWTELLGFGDFYYELSVQIVQVCISTRDRNGGLIEWEELKRLLVVLRGSRGLAFSEYVWEIPCNFSFDDITQSLKCLKPLGDGYRVVQIGSKKMVQSVPEELNADNTNVLILAEGLAGHVSVDIIIKNLKWETERAQQALDSLIREGICWIDSQTYPEAPHYYIAALF